MNLIKWAKNGKTWQKIYSIIVLVKIYIRDTSQS